MFKWCFNPIGTNRFQGLDRKNGILDLSIFKNLTFINSGDLRYIVHLNKLICPPSVTIYDTCFYGSTIDTIIVENMEQQTSLLWVSLLKILSSKVKIPLNKERGLRMAGIIEKAQEYLFQTRALIYTRQVRHSLISQNISILLVSIIRDTHLEGE